MSVSEIFKRRGIPEWVKCISAPYPCALFFSGQTVCPLCARTGVLAMPATEVLEDHG